MAGLVLLRAGFGSLSVNFSVLKAVSGSEGAKFSPLEDLIQFVQRLIWLYRAVLVLMKLV
jgi:hypothetical protein